MGASRTAVRVARRELFADRARTALVVALIAVAAVWFTITAGEPWRGGVGALMVGVAVLVEVSALAVGDRERLRIFGLLDVNGARGNVQRSVVLLEAVMLGVAGTTFGLALGSVWRGVARHPSSALAAGDVAQVLLVGVGASLLAGVVSAARARRVASRDALAGRRPSTPLRVGWPIGAATLVGLGAVTAGSSRTWTDMTFLVPLGGALLAGGAVALAVSAVSVLERPTRVVGGVFGQAGRGLGRQRYRSGPVVAVMTVVVGVCMVGAVLGHSFGEREQRRLDYRARHPAPIASTILPDDLVRLDRLSGRVSSPDADAADRTLFAAVQGTLPGATPLPLMAATHGGAPDEPRFERGGGPEPETPLLVLVGDRQLLDAFDAGGRAQDLALGRAVAFTPRVMEHGQVSIQDGLGNETRLPAVLGAQAATRAWPAVVISEATATGLQIQKVQVATLFRSPAPLSPDVASTLRALAPRPFEQSTAATPVSLPPGEAASFLLRNPLAVGGEPTIGSPYGAHQLFSSSHPGDLAAGPYINTDAAELRTMVTTGAALAAAVLVIALALASLDRRRDDELYALLGASHGFRRRLGAAQAALLASPAVVIGGGLGLAAPAYGFWFYNGYNREGLPPIPFVVPVDAVIILVVGLPIAATLATWALTPPIGALTAGRLDD